MNASNVARAAVQVRLVGHGARVALAVRVERLAPNVAAVQGVHALEREAQPRLAAGSARLGSGSLSRVSQNKKRKRFWSSQDVSCCFSEK